MGSRSKRNRRRGTVDHRPKTLAQRNQHNGQTAAISEEIIQAWSGPLPPPDALEAYNRFMPGAGEAIVKNFLANDEFMRTETGAQSQHRRGIETVYVRGNERRTNLGQFMAFGLALAFIGVGAWLVILGHDGAGATSFTVGGGGGIALYVSGRDVTKNQKSRRAD